MSLLRGIYTLDGKKGDEFWDEEFGLTYVGIAVGTDGCFSLVLKDTVES